MCLKSGDYIACVCLSFAFGCALRRPRRFASGKIFRPFSRGSLKDHQARTKRNKYHNRQLIREADAVVSALTPMAHFARHSWKSSETFSHLTRFTRRTMSGT